MDKITVAQFGSAMRDAMLNMFRRKIVDFKTSVLSNRVLLGVAYVSSRFNFHTCFVSTF